MCAEGPWFVPGYGRGDGLKLHYVNIRQKSTVANHLEPGLLKCASPFIAGSVAHIFYLTLFPGTIPKAWNSAYVLPLHRGVDSI